MDREIPPGRWEFAGAYPIILIRVQQPQVAGHAEYLAYAFSRLLLSGFCAAIIRRQPLLGITGYHSAPECAGQRNERKDTFRATSWRRQQAHIRLPMLVSSRSAIGACDGRCCDSVAPT